jgi:hypothetical protein
VSDQLNIDMVRTGLLLPEPGFVSSMPVFAENVDLLPEDKIIEMANSGLVDGRKRYDESWVCDQRDKGSCNGWAGASALAKSRVDRGLDRVDLSGAYLYSLINRGGDNGSLLDEGMRAMQERGVATAATVKWDQIYPSLYDKAKADAEAAENKGFECYRLTTRAELFTALAVGFKCVVAVDVQNQFMRLDSLGRPGGSNGPGNHAVHADGLAVIGGKLLATAANSWGTVYGLRGRMNLDFDMHFASTIGIHGFYAVRSTLDGRNKFPTVSN